MAQQDRAIRTKRQLLEAAAKVFEAHGYDGATVQEILDKAGLTKGSMYYHFKKKEELAVAVLKEQVMDIQVEPQPLKLQEFVDIAMVLAYMLRTNPIQQAAARLTMEQGKQPLDRAQAMRDWTTVVVDLMSEARARGEIRLGADIEACADLYVGAFAGIQNQSRALCNREDLGQRLTVLFTYTMPSIAVPEVLVQLDVSPERGEKVAKAMAGPVQSGDETAAELVDDQPDSELAPL
ncbi:ScbR family autoregulator-binding transcription factor [Streptomyces chattanoogensis]|uniref:ScbR family autoregulator-binding transcription factor n=1 Tax=Streptomyces chattanoogensis TaxID=66876 RepID=UPI0036BEE817